MSTEKICHVTHRTKFWITKNLEDCYYDIVYTEKRICLFPSEPPRFWRDIEFAKLGLLGGDGWRDRWIDY
jgi:hypothetical protein